MKFGILSTVVLIAWTNLVIAQEEDINWDSPNPDFAKHFQVGVPIPASFSIEINGSPGTVTWNYYNCTPPSCPGSPSFIPITVPPPLPRAIVISGITVTFNATNITFSGSPTLPAGANSTEITFGLRVTGTSPGGATPRFKTYHFIIREPMDLVFALDRSGSMECDIDESTETDWIACESTNTAASPDNRRWDMLKGAVSAFATQADNPDLLLGGTSGDRISVVYFAGTAISGGLVNDAIATRFTTIPLFRTGISTDMSSAPIESGGDLARDGTSIGSGLFKSLDNRFGGGTDPNRRQILILFTDGEQNTSSWVDPGGATPGKIILSSSSPGASTLANLSTTFGPIEVLTASFVNAPSGSSLVAAIADSPADNFPATSYTGDPTAFQTAMGNFVFNRIFGGTSPQNVKIERLNANQATVRSDFECNNQVSRLFFSAYFNAGIGRQRRYRIEKDGVDYTQYARIQNISDYTALFIIDLYRFSELNSKGKWSFFVLGSNDVATRIPASVTMIATADDHNVDFDARLRESLPRVGKVLTPTVKLAEKGVPITNATVKAIISKPGDDLGDLLARTPASNFPQRTSETGTCASQKYYLLETQNPGALAKLKQYQDNTITLTHTGNGNYTGTYGDVDVSGIYKVVYLVEFNSPISGPIVRTLEQNTYVKYAPLTPSLGKHSVSLSKDAPNNFFKLELTPAFKDPRGNVRLLGPGFENSIHVTSGGSTVVARASSNCDGEYEVFVSGGENANPNIRVTIGGEEYYEGKVNGFAKPAEKGHFVFSVHAGVTNPISQSLDSLFNRGLFGEIDLGYRFSPGFSLEAVGGYYGFESNYNVLGGTLYAQAHPTIGNALELTLGAGVGYYKPKSENPVVGGSVRAGIGLVLNKLVLGAEYAQFLLNNTPRKEFSTLGGFLKLRL